MGKLTSLNGKVTGKIGAIVYSTSAGQIVAREYNPNVANPNTVKQINQRARMKLASQVAAAISPVIAIAKEGLVSARNQFIKMNMDYFVANNGVAQVSYENLQLVKGNAGLPAIHVSRSLETGMVVELSAAADASVSRVVYCVFKKTDDNTLQYVSSLIQNVAGEDGKFKATFSYVADEVVIWAYGILDVTSGARARYSNYSVSTAQDIASLVMTRQLNTGDYQFTKTRGTTIFEGQAENIQASASQVMVYLTASGPGSVACDKFSGLRGAVDKGTEITLTATPNSNCRFLGWRKNGTSQTVSTANPYKVTANESVDLVGVFDNPGSTTGGDNGGGGDSSLEN